MLMNKYTISNIKELSLLVVVLLAIFLGNALGNNVIISDGDSIKLAGVKIRLYGIDAPESKQKCYDINGKSWDCGLVAKDFLVKLINNREVVCRTLSTDLYKRKVAICYASDDELNRMMVQSGMAIAYRGYSKKYVPDELLAKKEFLGIWNSSFMEPELWRKYKKLIKNSNTRKTHTKVRELLN